MSVSTYECGHCGASLGIAGESSGSDEDYAADEFYASEVEHHESGQCKAAAVKVAAAPTGITPAALRALADLIESKDLPEPARIVRTDGGAVTWNVWDDDAAAKVAALARRIGGTWAKNDPAKDAFTAMYYQLTRDFHGLTLEILAERAAVCERVQVGERTITREVPTATTTVTETEPVYEWRCVPLLAKAEGVSA